MRAEEISMSFLPHVFFSADSRWLSLYIKFKQVTKEATNLTHAEKGFGWHISLFTFIFKLIFWLYQIEDFQISSFLVQVDNWSLRIIDYLDIETKDKTCKNQFKLVTSSLWILIHARIATQIKWIKFESIRIRKFELVTLNFNLLIFQIKLSFQRFKYRLKP